MDINKITDHIEAWLNEDLTHTSAFVFLTTKSEADKAPCVYAYVNGNKNDTLQALAATAYENPEIEEFLTRALTVVKLLREQGDTQADTMHHTSRKEGNYAS